MDCGSCNSSFSIRDLSNGSDVNTTIQRCQKSMTGVRIRMAAIIKVLRFSRSGVQPIRISAASLSFCGTPPDRKISTMEITFGFVRTCVKVWSWGDWATPISTTTPPLQLLDGVSRVKTHYTLEPTIDLLNHNNTNKIEISINCPNPPCNVST